MQLKIAYLELGFSEIGRYVKQLVISSSLFKTARCETLGINYSSSPDIA